SVPPPAKQLLRAQPVSTRHVRHGGAGLEAFDNDTGLVVARPAPPTSRARDQLKPAHIPGLAITLGQLTFKLMLKRMLKLMFKTIAHGPALRHSPSPAEMWEQNTAYDSTES